jgi:hypothetical protein
MDRYDDTNDRSDHDEDHDQGPSPQYPSSVVDRFH